ncbi:Uncharacterised protein [uncultured archaeon]|nr:Uncharacterised protein [uncultured archaeon]
MTDENKLFAFIDSKVVYSLSFLLITFTLRDSIISLFSSGITFKILWFDISPDQFLNAIIFIQFLSIYFYGINYVIKDPLNRVKRIMNWTASVLWFISFLSPFYILIILVAQSLFIKGAILTIISLIFATSGIFASIWSEKKDRENDSMELEEEIEKLKLEPANKDNVAEFIRYYLILDSMVKNAIVEKMNIPIEEDESIDIKGASNLLLENNWIKLDTKERMNKIETLHNRIVHEDYKISEKEIEQVRGTIKEFDDDIKKAKGK